MLRSNLLSLAQLDIAIDPDTGAEARTATLRLAERFRLSLYDAGYLEFAHRRLLPLASLDGELRGVASTLGISLLAAERGSYRRSPKTGLRRRAGAARRTRLMQSWISWHMIGANMLPSSGPFGVGVPDRTVLSAEGSFGTLSRGCLAR